MHGVARLALRISERSAGRLGHSSQITSLQHCGGGLGQQERPSDIGAVDQRRELSRRSGAFAVGMRSNPREHAS